MVSEGETVELTVSTGPALAAVPDVIGRTEDEALFILRAEGFEVTVETVENDDAESGTVFSQDPAAGTEVAEGSDVRIQVSLGPGDEVVPDVSGQSLASAQSELQAKGFRIGGPEEQSSDSVPAGQVIATEPGAGATAPRGSTVTVIVSTGVERVSVPDVVNESESSASATLRGSGFEVSVTTVTVPPGDAAVGRVTAQDPSGGAQAPKGSTVEISVGVASTTSSTSSSTSSTAP